MANRPSEVSESIPWPSAIAALSMAAIVGMEMILARGWDNRFVSDDWKFLYTVSTMQSPRELLSLLNFSFWGFIRPFQYAVTYALYSVFRLDPAGYHLTMQVLDLANAFMAGLFTFQIVSALGAFEKRTNRIAVSITVSLLFVFSWRRHEAIYWYSGETRSCLAFSSS